MPYSLAPGKGRRDAAHLRNGVDASRMLNSRIEGAPVVMKLWRASAVGLAIVSIDTPTSLAAEDMAACKTLKSDKARLACFDGKLAEASTLPTSDWKVLSVTDVLTDASDLKGKTVTFAGFAIAAGVDKVYVYKARGEMNALIVDTSRLPRDQRRAVIEGCGGGCDLTVTGKIGAPYMPQAVAAEKATVRPE